MRLSLLSLALLTLAGLTTAPAIAEVGDTSRYHYETCTCTFGYGKACVTAVSCTSEGGYCSGSCQGGGRSSHALRVRG
jgi:hypothetical protein